MQSNQVLIWATSNWTLIQKIQVNGFGVHTHYWDEANNFLILFVFNSQNIEIYEIGSWKLLRIVRI